MDDSFFIAIGFGLVAWIFIAAWERWVEPRLTQRQVNKLLRDFKAGKISAPKKRSKYTIAFDVEGFVISEVEKTHEPSYKFIWSEIHRIAAYKEDWFSVDCICLAIGNANEYVVRLDEEMQGWNEFVEALPAHLPGCRLWSDWFSQVAFPAFATNLTEIYRSSGNQKSDRHDPTISGPA